MPRSRDEMPTKIRSHVSDKEWACLTLMSILVVAIVCATCMVVYTVFSRILDI